MLPGFKVVFPTHLFGEVDLLIGDNLTTEEALVETDALEFIDPQVFVLFLLEI